MTLKQALILASQKLKNHDISSASLDAEILLSFVLKRKREYLLAHPEQKLTPKQIKKFRPLISRRAQKEPVAYLIHQKEFYGLDFYVDKNVLIPRPETELIIEEVKKIISPTKKSIIIDLGTGSGCLAIALAKISLEAPIYGIDISPQALKVAQKNARRHLVKIKFLPGDLLLPLPQKIWQSKRKKIILANLPYLSEKYKKDLKTTSLKYEPPKALWGGKDGLKYYRLLLKQIQKIINSDKPFLNIFLEINPEQSQRLQKMIKQYIPKVKIKIKKDLSGLERMVRITFPASLKKITNSKSPKP